MADCAGGLVMKNDNDASKRMVQQGKIHHLDGIVQQINTILTELDWPVKELTSARYFSPSQGLINESYGCYTKPKEDIDGVWVGFVSHRRIKPGIYVTLPLMITSDTLIPSAFHDGYKESHFGPHPLIKQLMTETELERIRDQAGNDALSKKLKLRIAQSFPFTKKKLKKCRR